MTAGLEEICRLEDVGLATWPALEETHDGRWVLRAAAGVTKRSNSVSPLGAPTAGLDQAVAHAAAWYRRRSLRPMFRLTPLAPAALEPRLAAAGYEPGAPVDVMTRRLEVAPGPASVRIRDELTDEWLNHLMAHRFPEGTPRRIVRSMLSRLQLPTAYVSHGVEGPRPATAMGVVADPVVAIYAMYTPPLQRRTGAATTLLTALLAWGAAQGATLAFLQVLSENQGARTFYARHGFETRYRYWYRVGPPAPMP